MKKAYLISLIFNSITSFCQVTTVIDNKGTLKTVDNSKWTSSGTNIFNKNTGNVGIGTSTPGNFLEVRGVANSTTSGLRLTGLGAVTPTTPLSNVLSVNTNGDVVMTTNPNSSNWFLTGNTTATSANFLGTTNDVRMSIRSNNVPIFEFGRRATLGLTQGFVDYDNPNQNMVHLRGGGTSALQFEATNAAFYKPIFFTTVEGNFRLKGSAAGTDFFEMGSSGATNSNNGSFDITIGDDGNEPIILRKYNYSPQGFVEMMRLQGTGLNNDVRVGIKTNGVVANSTLQIIGSMSLPIVRTTANLTLDETHYTVIITGNHSITLPAANTCIGRIYVLKNIGGGTRTISSYIGANGNATTTLPNNVTTIIQSDGTDWQSISER